MTVEKHRQYHKMSDETRQKMSKSLKGKKRSEEFKQKVSKTLQNRELSEEHKEKISKALKGTKQPNYAKFGEKNGMFGRESPTKGLTWWNNGIKQILAEQCPEGYQKGMLLNTNEKKRIASLGNKSNTGKKWWTNGIVSVIEFECPKGFWAGRIRGKK